MAKKKKTPKTWMLPSPTQRTAKAPLPERIKADVDAKATKLVEKLKPKYIQPPPKEPRFNYIIDVWTKWIGGTLYFGTTYACPGPTAISPSFEAKLPAWNILAAVTSPCPTCGIRRSGSSCFPA